MASQRYPAQTTVPSYCRICAACCGTLVTKRGQQIIRIDGDREHPLSRGYTCSKGRAATALHHHPDRIRYPLVRSGDKLLRATWDEALDDLAGRLEKLRSETRPDAIGAYLGTHSFAESGATEVPSRLISGLGSRSAYSAFSIDFPNKWIVPRLMTGRFLMPIPDYSATTLLIYFGSNPLVSHGHAAKLTNPVHYIREVQKRGKVWVIDTRRTKTARMADRHVMPRATSDHAIMAYLVRELLREGADQEFLAAHAKGVEALRNAMERFDSATASHESGLDEADLTDLLNDIRLHGRCAIETGTGLSMGRTANIVEWLRWVLMVITGSADRPRGWWFNRGYFEPMPAAPLPDVPYVPERGPGSNPTIPSYMGQYPCATMAEEIDQGNLRALMVFGGNPVVAFPNEERTVRTLRKLDALAVWDIMPSRTTELATHVFPALDSLERTDLLMASAAQPGRIVQYAAAAVDPVGEGLPVWQSLAMLAARLGVAVLPEGVDPQTGTTNDYLAAIASTGAVPFENVKAYDGAMSLGDPDFGWVTTRVLPGGRWDLAPEQIIRQLDRIEPNPSLALQCRRQSAQANSLLAHESEETTRFHLSRHEAAAAGVKSGDQIRVRNRHGAVEGIANVDGDIVDGIISIPHGFNTMNVQRLTSDTQDVDPLTGMPLLIGVAVEIYRLCSRRNNRTD